MLGDLGYLWSRVCVFHDLPDTDLEFAFKFAKLGGLNQGVIPIVTVTATIYNGVIFYFYFGEKLSMSKLFGMALTIVSVVFLGLDSMEKKQTVDNIEYETKYAWYALAFALIVPV